ncbi:hypothetical protein [Pseudomonas sp.]|jgi:hypothetical protein|uniref:hypothetical protein n=1 Tax=Pseudomonas sp. TaxID=306 RepID=UPI002E2F08F4|nr:hypothetical protein [Pseudomonas sp.]HEX4546832.1 hypothetical protein [Pseudomonas sp.]
MLNDDNTPLTVDPPLTDSDLPTEHPVESVTQASRQRMQPDAENTTEPRRNTGGLDSLGGGKLP